MTFQDDELLHFEAHGATPLSAGGVEGTVDNQGSRIWYAAYGSGPAVILLHGGLGHSGNWGHQVPALVEAGYQAIVLDSRGHGRSTRDAQPYSYGRMAGDLLAVLDTLRIERACLVGWSDGACTALVFASAHPERTAGVFFFACNMDPSGVKPFAATPALDRCFSRHKQDYAALSATPDAFESFVADLSKMQQTQPDYSSAQLAAIEVPVLVAQSEHDEFIRLEHAQYLARTIPGAELLLLEGVSHFAPLQRPAQFNAAILDFAKRVLP
jgi:pimeloyl-ACP methyl ester carboxylesterase